LVSIQSSAQTTAPVVNIEIEPKAVAVGEKVTLRLSIFVPTWFSSPPVFPSLELVNAITRLPPDSSYPGSLKVDGETWSGIIREYEIYPLVGDRFSFPEQTISAKYADPETNTPVETEVIIPSIDLVASVPEGAEQLNPYIGGISLELEQLIDGDITALKAGDAMVVTYTAALDGMPSVFLPPLYRDSSQAGISSYVAEPVFSDEKFSTRIEKVTFVFEQGGEVEIPGISVRWWNSKNKTIETVSTDPIQVTVESIRLGEAGKLNISVLSQSGGWKRWVLAGLCLLILAYLIKRKWPDYQRRRQQKRSRYLASEEYAYRQLQDAIKSEELGTVYRALLGWHKKRLTNSDINRGIQELIHDIKGPAFYLKQISEVLYGGISEEINFAEMTAELDKTRSRLLKSGSVVPRFLPELNP
jgi:hypothetical protein